MPLPSGISALDQYIRHLNSLTARKRAATVAPLPLERGKRLEKADFTQYLYEFAVSDEHAAIFRQSDIAAGTLTLRERSYRCSAVAAARQDGYILCCVPEDLGEQIEAGSELTLDEISPLAELSERLVNSGFRQHNEKLAQAVMSGGPITLAQWEPKRYDPAGLNPVQQAAIRTACKNTVTYLWTPPATGKTSVLSSLVRTLLDEPRARILVCSATGRALDLIFLKLCRDLGEEHSAIRSHQIVRAGIIANEDLRAKWAHRIQPAGIIGYQSSEVRERYEDRTRRLAAADKAGRESGDLKARFEAFDRLNLELNDLKDDLNARDVRLREADSRRNKTNRLLRLSIGELEDMDQSIFFVKWFKRPRKNIVTEIQLAKNVVSRAEADFQRASVAQAEALDKVITHEAQIASLAGQLQSVDRAKNQEIFETSTREVYKLNEEISSLETRLTSLKHEEPVIHSAKVVGATLSTMLAAPPGLFQTFDHVLIDEASAHLAPAVYWLAGMATQKTVISGDFQQRQPRIGDPGADLEQSLGMDVFRSSGADKIFLRPEASADPKYAMLTQQLRMPEPVAKLLSAEFYAGKLVSPAQRESSKPMVPAPFDHPLIVVDISGGQPMVRSDGSSWLAALTAKRIAGQLAASSLAVYAPWAAQCALLKQVLGRDSAASINLDVISPVVILDTSGAPLKDAETLRFMHMAISSTENTLIVIADLSVAPLSPLLERASTLGRTVDVRTVLETPDFAQQLKRDLEAAVSQILIFSTEVSADGIAAYAGFLGRDGGGPVARYVVPSATLSGFDFTRYPVATRPEVHANAIVIDRRIVWFGSTPPLGPAGAGPHVMLRCEDAPWAEELARTVPI